MVNDGFGELSSDFFSTLFLMDNKITLPSAHTVHMHARTVMLVETDTAKNRLEKDNTSSKRSTAPFALCQIVGSLLLAHNVLHSASYVTIMR